MFYGLGGFEGVAINIVPQLKSIEQISHFVIGKNLINFGKMGGRTKVF